MNENCPRDQIVNLVMQLEDILVVLDREDAKLAAIKVDEAISALCQGHDICRAGQERAGYQVGLTSRPHPIA